MLNRKHTKRWVGRIWFGLGENLVARNLTTKIYSFWADEAAISSVEYALLLAFVATSIIMGAEQLSTAVSDEILAAASCFDGQVDANGGQGGGTGAGGGSGGGSGNGGDQGDGFAIC